MNKEVAMSNSIQAPMPAVPDIDTRSVAEGRRFAALWKLRLLLPVLLLAATCLLLLFLSSSPVTPARAHDEQLTLQWIAPEPRNTFSVAWGDVDGDGDLDLAVGNSCVWGTCYPNQLYRNTGGTLTLDAGWTPAAANTDSVTWGDVDGDGDLDLLVGNNGQPNQLYRNDSGTLTLDTVWNPITNTTTSVAWGDVDGDGDLDLAVGNSGAPNQLYRNTGGTLTLDTAWNPITRTTQSVAWGDVDGDGDLDLAVGNGCSPGSPSTCSPNQLYHNAGGTLVLTWAAPIARNTTSVAWGDVDGDGDLDLAVGNGCVWFTCYPNQLYRNTDGALMLSWTAPTVRDTTSGVSVKFCNELDRACC